MTMAWWQISVLGLLILALAIGAALLLERGRLGLGALVVALAGAMTWVAVGLMLGGIAPGRTTLMLPASTGVVPEPNDALRVERGVYDRLTARHPEIAPQVAGVERLREAGDEAGLSRARLALLSAYLPVYAPRASDAAITRFAAVATENLEQLFERDPLLCRETASGRASALVETLTQRATGALGAVLDSAMSAPQEPPDAVEAIELRRRVIDALYETGDPGLVARPMLARSAQAPPEPYCRTFIRIFREILALPPAEAGKILRFYYGQEGRNG